MGALLALNKRLRGGTGRTVQVFLGSLGSISQLRKITVGTSVSLVNSDYNWV